MPDDSGNSPRNQANRADNTEKKRATGVKEARQKLEDVDQGYFDRKSWYKKGALTLMFVVRTCP